MLLKSLNYWSVPGGLENSLDPIEFLEIARAHRFPAVELAIGETGGLNLDTGQDECERILRRAADLGVKVASVASGLYWSRAVGDSDDENRSRALRDAEAMIQIAGWLGVRTLLFIPGAVDVFFLPDRTPQPYLEVRANAIQGISQLLPSAERAKVRLGIENVWNKFLLSPAELVDFIDHFGSPFLGAYLDVGNVLPFGYPQDWLRTLGSRVVGIHFKDFRRAVGTADGFVDLLEGDVEWPAVMKAIKEIGYDGPIAAEMIPCYKHAAMVRIANTSNAMDAILDM